MELGPSDPEWSHCDVKRSKLRIRCGDNGGGYYPVTLYVKEYIDWEPVITSCEITYTKTDTLTLLTDPSTLPDVLALIELFDESFDPGG